MTTLIFLGTLITILLLFIRLIIELYKRKSIISSIKTLGIIILSYALLWVFFYFFSSFKSVPLGTDICFDDWCATITRFEIRDSLGVENQTINPNGRYVILNIRMSNHARGIAQKPSEPRVHIMDDKGHYWPYSLEGQQALEKLEGKQTPIDIRLELHQSLETRLVFKIPNESKYLKVIIEEGPFITKLLFNDRKEVFLLQQ
jgi:hypothetical protein